MSRSRPKSRSRMTAASSSAGPRRVAHQLQRGLAVGAVQLLFHMRQRGAHDVVVVHVRTDGPDDVEPEPVNVFEVFGRERGRVRAEVIGGGAAARVMDDQPDVDGRRLASRAPRLRRAAAPDRRPTAFPIRRRESPPTSSRSAVSIDRVEDVHAGHDQQPHGAPFALRRRHDRREQLPLVVRSRADPAWDRPGRPRRPAAPSSRRRRDRRRRGARRRGASATCGRRTGTRKLPGPRLHLPQVHIVRRQQLELVERTAAGARAARRPIASETTSAAVSAATSAKPASEGGSAIATRPPAATTRSAAATIEPERPLAPADRTLQRHAVGARLGADRAVADERRQLEDRRDDDRDGVGAREPRRLTAGDAARWRSARRRPRRCRATACRTGDAGPASARRGTLRPPVAPARRRRPARRGPDRRRQEDDGGRGHQRDEHLAQPDRDRQLIRDAGKRRPAPDAPDRARSTQTGTRGPP